LGNAVILKPHPHSILCGGFVFARIFEEAGFPSGLLQVLPADGDDAKTFETDPNISMVHFTGSTPTAARVAELSSKYLKKVSVSGSGKNPLVILDDVSSMDAAISTAVFSTFYFGGQSCMTAGRHLIQRTLYSRYCSGLAEAASKLNVGDPIKDESVFYGPMIDPHSVKRLHELIDDARSKGAELLCGGTSVGNFFAPTVLKDVDSSMRVWQEEIFGPIAAVTAFDTDEDAVQLANSTSLGLSGAVLGSLTRAREVANRLHTGMVHINDKTTDDCAYVPFGGVKGSGNGGRYGSYVNWDEYTQVRWFTESNEAKTIAGFKK
jgi:benzaldehyde dehydrogenase (NAD)